MNKIKVMLKTIILLKGIIIVTINNKLKGNLKLREDLCPEESDYKDTGFISSSCE